AAREHAKERRQAFGQVEGQRTVRKEMGIELQRVKRELEDRVADGAFVGMKEMALVEIEAKDTDGKRGRRHRGKEPPRAAGDGRSHAVPSVSPSSLRMILAAAIRSPARK